MPICNRLLTLLAVLLLTLSATGIVVAQSDGPDPNSPIKLETPGADDEPGAGESDEGEDPNADAEDENDATPESVASPVADGDASLAAMTLDAGSLPEGWFLIQESYTTGEDLANGLAGQIDPEALLATGIELYYDSYYVNADGNTLRTYVIAFETPAGAADGFAILEDEDTLVPNGGFEDLPGLEGVGSEPSEISRGSIENGDGTQTNSYDVSFTIGRYEVGAAMETYDGSDPDTDMVDQMAVDIEARVNSVIAGEQVDGVVYSLPGQLIELDASVAIEGFQTAAEAFLLSDPELVPDGYLSGYYRSASFSESISSILPYLTVGISAFESASDVDSALDSTDSIMPLYEELEEVNDIDVDGADRVVAFTFASPEGAGEADSARIFIQIDDQLISIDVQGAADIDEALSIAQDIAELQITCAIDGECVPANIGGGTTL